jgi:mRNA interferase RelE/StbE
MSEWIIRYHHEALTRDLPRLDPSIRAIIRKAVNTKLAASPEIFGKPLKGTLKGLWSLRVGDWRVIFRMQDREVLIVTIGHRRDVYDYLKKKADWH